jgi:tetratricopeptide (TPR) repeat protein
MHQIMDEQNHSAKRRKRRRGKEADPQLANALATNPINKDDLLRVVGDLCGRFSSRPAVRQPHPALLDAFETLEEKQEAVCGANRDEGGMVAVSCAMRAIVDAELSCPDLDSWNRFVSLYHAWVAVRAAELLHRDPEVKAWLARHLQEALTIGRNLCANSGRDGIPEKRHEPQTTFNRMVKICDAVVDNGLVEDGEREGVVLLRELCRERAAAPSEYEKAEELCSKLIATVSAPGFKPEDCEDVVQRACATRWKKPLFEALQALSGLRFRLSEDGDRVHDLSEIMFRVSTALCAFPVVESNLLGAFHDRYALYDSVRMEKELLARSTVFEAVKKAIWEAHDFGLRVLKSQVTRERLLRSESTVIGHFYSRLGEVCRVYPDYDLCSGHDLRAVLEQGVEAFQKASEVPGLSDGRHAAFNLPKLAGCLRSLGRLGEAAVALGRLFDGARDIEPKTLWEAHRVASEIAMARAWAVGEDEPEGRVAFLSEAERHAIEAGRVWEPEGDLRAAASEHPNNLLIHSLLAWVYLNKHEWQAAATQAQFFLDADDQSKVGRENANFRARTVFVLAQALVELGNLRGAAAALRELLEYGPDPRFQVLPLAALLRVQRQLGEPKEALDLTIAEFLQACQRAEIQFSLDRFSEEQLEALSSPDAVGVSVRRARAMLDSGRVEEVLEMLPIMVAVARLGTGEDSPALLTLLAEADRQAGKLEDALKTLKYVTTLDSSRKNQSVAWTELGNVYEAVSNYPEALKAFQRSYQTYGFHPSALVGCCRCLRRLGRVAEAVGLIQLHQAADGVWPGAVVREMTILLGEPSAGAALKEGISRTSNPWFLELVQRAMPIDIPVSASVVAAAHERLTQADVPLDVERALLKLLSRELAQSYFAAKPGDRTFEQLAQAAAGEALSAAPDLRRRWLFSLLTSCRDAVLFGTLYRYVEAARGILAPLLEEEADGSDQRDWNECLLEMNDLLLNRLPERLRPSCYGASESVDVHEPVESLLEGIRQKLNDHIRHYGRRFSRSVQDGPLNSGIFNWLNVAQAMKRLFDFSGGPLAVLVSQADDWQIEVTVGAGRIDSRMSLEMCRDATRSGTAEMVGRLDGFRNLEVDVDVSAFPKIRLSVGAQLDAPALLAVLARFAPLFGYLDSMQTEALEAGRVDPDFFKKAERLLPGPGDDVFLATPTEWSRLLCQRYDQQFANTLLWLTESPRGPNRVLHELKGQLRGCIEAAGRDDALARVRGLRESARQAFSRLVRFTLSRVEESRPSCDVVGIARRLVSERSASASEVEIIENYVHEPLVCVHAISMGSILSSLLENAVLAATRAGGGQVTLSVRQVIGETSVVEALITVFNPYDPTLPEDQASTGLGRKTARYLAKDNGGRFDEDRDQVARKWTTRVWLPVTV